MARRSQSNDGSPSHCERYLPLSPRDLARLLAIFGPEEKAEKVKHIFHGPKAARGAPPVVLTDEQVMTIRRMAQWYGMKRREIVAATGLSVICIETVIRYRNRVHLDPGHPRACDVVEA